MKTLFDASSFAKRYFEERGSQEVENICKKTTVLGLCVILVPEIISGLSRHQRDGLLSMDDYMIAKKALLQDIKDAQVINLSPKIIAIAISFLENNVLRAMDALHIACAVEWGAQLFVTSDTKQIVAAKNAGLKVKSIT